jgi:hypothetical protein
MIDNDCSVSISHTLIALIHDNPDSPYGFLTFVG